MKSWMAVSCGCLAKMRFQSMVPALTSSILLSGGPIESFTCSSGVCFSSRRRHTRFDCDWSSDVCSSDLNPYPLGINWESSLEVAFRSVSWLWVYYLLADCPLLPPDFGPVLSQGLALNGTYIERYLSTYFSPNTHLLGEAVALLMIGTFCSQLSSANRWRDKGWRIVLEEADRQVRADGMHFEQSLYYHVYALDFFLHARLTAIHNGWENPPHFDHILEKMLGVFA